MFGACLRHCSEQCRSASSIQSVDLVRLNMKSKTNKSINLQSETSDSIRSEKTLKLDPGARGARINARQILCSFSLMLTERERMALHWLAEGLSVREIARRLAIGNRTVIEATHKLPGAARRLRLDAAPGSLQNKMSGAGPSLTRRSVPTTTSSPNENPS